MALSTFALTGTAHHETIWTTCLIAEEIEIKNTPADELCGGVLMSGHRTEIMVL